MDARHELSVDPTRLLSGVGFDGPQRPQPYGDLCRPPGSDASTLSYHSRYLASMPLTNGSTFPFLGGMFTGTLPGPPTSPFRAPSTPGVNNMRFWPPTPPPEGYGRYSMNTSLFPLFGAPSPDSGAFLSQGLVSRLGSTTHLSPVIDHKEHSFFTHGIGLGSPLTPTSHVTSPSPFPHLIPSLDRHPAYIGHMTLSSKDMEDIQHESDDVRLMKSHMDCIMKHNIPSSRQDRLKSKSEAKLCCEKSADDCCKLSSPPCIPRDNSKSHETHRHGSKLEGKHHSRHQPTNKVQPCKIEVSHSPALKHDLLSPPIDSPRPDTTSPCKKKTAVSPVPLISSPSAVTNHVNSNETRCSQCCATMKGVGLATKISTNGKDGAFVSKTTDSHVSKNCPVVTTMSMTNSDFMSCAVSVNHSQATTEHAESKQTNQKSPRTSPVILPEGGEKLQDQSPFKPKNVLETVPSKSANSSSVALKHVTAAVIPTAPKQIVHREIHPEINCLPVQEASKEISGCEPPVSEVSSFGSSNQDVKMELNDLSVHSEKAALNMTALSSSPVFTANSPTMLSKPLMANCKVKDMIRNGSSAKQINGDKQQPISPFRNSELDLSKTMPNSPVKSVPSTTSVSPTIMTKSPCQNAKVLPTSLNSSSPVLKAEVVSARMDCEFSQRSTTWSKATVLPYNWQNNSNHDDQAINLTVSKKPVKPEPTEALSLIVKEDSTHQSSIKFGSEGAFPNSGVIGVCHPNPNPVAVNKVKGTPAVSSISNFSAISVVNQPSEQSTEVHILHRSSKSSFPIVNRNTTPPVPLKSTISHVTANTSIRSVKAERLTTKRGKLGEVDKLGHNGRAALATLAPKISKTVGFGKDSQASHTLSASSSVSSTSIVFPATVNPCIPVGIAIAQQRQDSSSTTTGKSQSSVPSTPSTPSTMTPNQNLAASRVAVDLQAQELLADQKNQDLSCSNNPTPVDTNLLVTQGPTIVSRQWESEALTRTAMPSASWLTHGSVVTPAVWLGQGAYAAAAPPSSAVPSIAMNPLEPSPISLPPGGYQLARDISGHLLLIPTANIELMDRPSMWPSFNAPTGNLPIQQLVTQQQHTQFEQVLPHTETIKTDGIETCNITSCDISAQTKTEEKVEEISGQVPSVPLATGQTYAFTTFPTQCDPSTFSYVLQSSTVMHLAHTQTAASIQTESGRRSQGTSPLHCVTPSPPPNNCSVQVSVTEDEEESDSNESDVACGELTEVRSCQSQSVTTAIQVDMDSQTNSEDEEEDHKNVSEKLAEIKVEMSDSANQTESVHSESPKSEPEPEPIEIDLKVPEAVEHQPSSPEPPKTSEPIIEVAENLPSISIKEDLVSSEPGMEIVTSETELAPSLPVESKPVMDFIDHHGLNLLVDSIEEFASRGQEEAESVTEVTAPPSNSVEPKATNDIQEAVSDTQPDKVAEEENPVDESNEKSYPSKYKNIDTSCTDSLGLLCALAEQRIFEEALNDGSKPKLEEKQDSVKVEDKNPKVEESLVKEQANSNDSFLSSSSSQDYEEASELDMRSQLAELQKKYRQKQRELELLRNKREKESSDDEMDSAPNSPATTKVTPLNKSSPVLHSKPLTLKESKHSKSSTPRPWKKQKKSSDKDVNENTRVKSSNFKKSKHTSNKTAVKDDSSEEEEHAKVPSITLVHETSAAISGDSSNSGSSFSRVAFSKKESKEESFGCENSSESGISKDEGSSQDQNYDKNDKSKVPVFDEQAWFVRRSERIFLSDARSVPTSTPDKSNKKSSSSSQKGSTEVSQKEKKEHVKPAKVTKNTEESDNKKVKNKSLIKPKTHLSKKIILSDSNDSESSSDEMSASDSENSDGASSTSDNLPLSSFVEHVANSKATPERQKRLSVDSACSDISSGQSEDIPLSVLMGQKEEDLPELKSCILKPAELQENARLLVLDEGLFYAGHVTKSDDPETFGILIDGDRVARPHMFSREEILNAAVLEVKPSHQKQLPEGTRICAFWSQQYRCLYPGTVIKASSPLPDPSILHVEFDDGDSGRISLNDIRMLPPDFPIVSMEPNPFMILGKRRSRAQSQNSCGTNDGKTVNDSLSQGQDKSELKKQKSCEKSSKKSHSEKKSKDGLKRKRSPSASNHSRSSSKSSISDLPDSKNQSSIIVKKDSSSDEQPKKKLKNSDPTSKDSNLKVNLSGESKPKKHKKHKDDHHKHHHHHHHKHHHHKKHKLEKNDRNHGDAVISSSSAGSSPRGESSKGRANPDQQQDTFVMENSKSELMFTIKKSPSPHTNLEEGASAADKKTVVEASGSSSSEEDEEPQRKKTKKAKQDSQNKPAKRKERVPSVEKSKIAAFLPVRQLWRWSGKSFRRPGAKGKGKKEFFRAIQRGKESIKVGDCAVFLSTGRPHLPYIGRIETMWESWGGKMDVKVKWFYHPEETKSGKRLSQLKGALFQSPHFDENDVQTISHKCEVLSWDEYQQKKHHGSLLDNNDTYFLAGTYDPILGTLILEPGVPNIPSNNAQDL